MPTKYGNDTHLEKKECKKLDHKARKEYWESLGLEGQLVALDDRLGKGVGAVKQRGRILRAMETPECDGVDACPR